MGGKRPDQYRIDPAEGQSTDHKWGPGHEDEHIKNEQKSLYRESRGPHPEEGFIPQSGENPALRELREGKGEPIPESGVNPALEELREIRAESRREDEAERRDRGDD